MYNDIKKATDENENEEEILEETLGDIEKRFDVYQKLNLSVFLPIFDNNLEYQSKIVIIFDYTRAKLIGSALKGKCK